MWFEGSFLDVIKACLTSKNTRRNIVDRAIKEGEPKSEIGEEESVNTNNLIELKNNEIYDWMLKIIKWFK